MIHLGTITEHAKFDMNIEYKAEEQLSPLGSVAMRLLSLGIPTRSSHCLHGEPSSGTVLTPQ